jgi:hypothetical protein
VDTSSYSRNWSGYVDGLQEVMEDLLFTIEQARRTGVRDDITCLEIYDNLNRYLDAVKQELGI